MLLGLFCQIVLSVMTMFYSVISRKQLLSLDGLYEIELLSRSTEWLFGKRNLLFSPLLREFCAAA